MTTERSDLKFVKCTGCGVKLAVHGIGRYKDCNKWYLESKGRIVMFEERRDAANDETQLERRAGRDAIRQEAGLSGLDHRVATGRFGTGDEQAEPSVHRDADEGGSETVDRQVGG